MLRTTMEMKKHRSALLFAAGLLIPVVMFGAWPARTEDGSASTRGDALLLANRHGVDYQQWLAQPLEDGEEVTYDRARSQTEYPVPIPDHSKARRQNARFFIDPYERVAEVFPSDVLMKMRIPQFADPEQEFRGLIESGSLPNGRIEYVRGMPALVVDAKTDQLQQNPASVQFVFRGVSITIYHPTMSTDELLEIAQTAHF